MLFRVCIKVSTYTSQLDRGIGGLTLDRKLLSRCSKARNIALPDAKKTWHCFLRLFTHCWWLLDQD